MSEIALDLVPEPEPDHTEWLLRLRASVATDIADDRHCDVIFAALITALVQRIRGATAIILTLDEKGATSMRASSAPPDINRLVHGSRRRNWFGSWASAIARQTDVVVSELAASSLYREHRGLFVEHALLASRSIPFLGRHNVVAGAMVVYLDEQRLLDPHELDVFEDVASLAALAIRHDQARQELLDRIRHDPLTGLENRDGLEDHLSVALNMTTPQGSSVGLLFVDIDDLTLVNDSLGHTAGDTVIATTAGRIKNQIMSSDTVVRFGGDEFIVVLDRISGVADARAVAERIRTAIGEPIDVAETSLTTTVSIGITLGRSGTPPLQLIDEGHAAVVRAKRIGRGSTAEHDVGLDTRAGERLGRELQLREGLDNDDFAIFWQPKVELSSGELIGAEALVRWKHPEFGVIGPDEFIGTAERAGMINELSDWILHQAIRESKTLAANTNFSMAINLSATQMSRPDIVTIIKDALDQHQLEPHRLIIELTESVLANHTVIAQLHELRDAGMTIAIDDFGTGYSSLAYVQQLPVGIVKVDRAFLDGLTEDGNGAPVLKAAVAMAHALGLMTTVEGVETAAQLEGLRALDVGWAQGYLFAEPRPLADLLELIKQDTRW